MRLWSIHPKYLDPQGLVALWREALLAQAVLAGRTRGYRAHPQLDRFRSGNRPLGLIATYLHAVRVEATAREYRFDASRILERPTRGRLTVSVGQLAWEWEHLMRKLKTRSAATYRRCRAVSDPLPHPLFRIVPGGLADWERGATSGPD
jgi:hypothetical protein